MENNKKKLAIFVKQGLDNFLADIMAGLSEEYETKKIIVENLKQIDEGIEWADICWFEWCDELIAYGSRSVFAGDKKIICRLHSYEAFTEYPAEVIWENVDAAIFVAEHIRNYVIDNFSIDRDKVFVVPNGIPTERWAFSERNSGFNIAYAGYINYKKGPMLLLHAFKAMFDRDNSYRLFIAGKFQDQRDVLYFNQMIKELGMENNIFYEGWQNDLDKWLEDKNYILCTSILESQNISIMQAMAKGIKPIIHNFVGAKTIYPEAFLWNTIEEAVNMVSNNEYASLKYRSFVKNNFELKEQIDKIKALITNLINEENSSMLEQPLVTIGIVNYNGYSYLSKCVDSFINQTYPNIEIIIVDDCSTDGSDKMIMDYVGKYDNIRSICHSVNSGGASRGIQEVINNANGKYVQWIASDDFAQYDAVYKFVEYLEKNPKKNYSFCDLNIVDEKNEKVNQWSYKVYPSNKVIEHVFKSASGLIPMNGLYRSSFFKDNNINWILYRNNDFSSDTLNSLQFIKYNWNYGKIEKAVINYRSHSSNLSYNLKKRIEASVSIFDYIIKNFKEEVYIPNIPWDRFSNKNQVKNYVLAKFYYSQIQDHTNMSAVPQYIKGNTTREELVKYCYPLAVEGMKYIDEDIKQDPALLSEILSLKELYNKYLDEVNCLEVIDDENNDCTGNKA